MIVFPLTVPPPTTTTTTVAPTTTTLPAGSFPVEDWNAGFVIAGFGFLLTLLVVALVRR